MIFLNAVNCNYCWTVWKKYWKSFCTVIFKQNASWNVCPFLSSYKFCVCVDNRANITAARFLANANRTCVCLSWSVYRNVTICPGCAQSLSLFVGQRLMAFLQTAQRECKSQSVEGNALCLCMLLVLIESHTCNSYSEALWTDLTVRPPVYTSKKQPIFRKKVKMY